MAENNYAYAVARIRSKELSLINSQTLEQLLSSKSYEDCMRLLADKGWNTENTFDAEKMLASERKKTWDLISELVDDMSVFDVFLYPNDFHNLKAAVKMVCTNSKVPGIFMSGGIVDYEKIIKAVKENDFSSLPEYLRKPGEKALKVMLHTRDGQLCDIILDKAALEAAYEAGKKSKNELIEKYAELTAAAADIKIAVRCSKTSKSLEFVKSALAHCDSLDTEKLAHAAVVSTDEICSYLASTQYADAVDEIKKSTSAFERWCDNLIIEYIRPQKYNPFTIAPIAAYLLARENEIKTVRIILSGKLNNLSEETIKERLRKMYV